VIGYSDGTLALFDYLTNKCEWDKKISQSAILKVKPHNCLPKIACAMEDGNICIYNFNTKSSEVVKHGGDAVSTLSFDPQGSMLISGSHDGSIKIHKLLSNDRSGQNCSEPAKELCHIQKCH